MAVASAVEALATTSSREVGLVSVWLFALIFCGKNFGIRRYSLPSACLLLLITAGAMIFSAIFERRFWCRYLCPMGDEWSLQNCR